MIAAIRLLRPKQWIKNGFVFAPLFFAHVFTQYESWLRSLEAAAAFICVSCVVYIINDIRDIEEDKLHPKKSKRPLAAGEMAVSQAIALAVVIAAGGAALLTLLPFECTVIVAVYLVLNFFYTMVLKHIALLDIFFIASCYVLRVLMGCYALQVTVSPWIILTTFLLALFLGFGKRYHEMGFEDYVSNKANLKQYSRPLLDKLVVITGGAALMAYAIYTTEIAQQLGRVEIVYTLAFVAFGLFRYLQMIYVYDQGGEPESVILKDRWQLVNVLLWLGVTLAIIS
jgi:4-hydroxybenzoate polyprenyltransferase